MQRLIAGRLELSSPWIELSKKEMDGKMDQIANSCMTELLREARKLHTKLFEIAEETDRCVSDCRSIWNSEGAELLFCLYDEECTGNALLKHAADVFPGKQDDGSAEQDLKLPNAIL